MEKRVDATRVLLFGACGAMGRTVLEVSKGMPDVCVVAGVDSKADDGEVPVFGSPKEVNVEFDVILDFSAGGNISATLDFAKERSAPLVIASTGQSEVELKCIAEAAKKSPVLKSANFSVAVNRFVASVAAFARCWHGDIEVVEVHHNKKVDAPSGTALMIANEIIESRGFGTIVLGRGEGSKARVKGEIGISAIRGGVVAGEHEVRFFDDTCEVSMKEREYGKGSFALGALEACKFMVGKPAGELYTMRDLLEWLC